MSWRTIDNYPRLRAYIEQKLATEGYTYRNVRELQSTLRSFGTGKGAEGWVGMLEGSRFSGEEYLRRYRKSKDWNGLFNEENNQLSMIAQFSDLINEIPETETVERLDMIRADLLDLEPDMGGLTTVTEINSMLDSRRGELMSELTKKEAEEARRFPASVPSGRSPREYVDENIPYEIERTGRTQPVIIDVQEVLIEKYGPRWRDLKPQVFDVEQTVIKKLINKGDTEGLEKTKLLPYNPLVVFKKDSKMREG